MAKGRFRHGHSLVSGQSPTYKIWHGMRQRCSNPNDWNYPRYGGAGVSVCERWADFANFLADMGERPEGGTIDRINPAGNYEPSNCRWASMKEQGNNRRNNLIVTYRGRTMTLQQLADDLKIDRYTLRRRVLGWPEDRWAEPPAFRNNATTKGRTP